MTRGGSRSEARSIAVVLGTRPEAIKLGRIIDLLGGRAWVIHTGQHYDPTLRDGVLTDVGLAPPHDSLTVGGTSRGQQLGRATAALDELFARHRPRAVVVQGDTNATAAAALAANANDIALVHVEAGLRSHDRAMPEEHNRVLVDHLADLCCAPTETAVEHLRREGIADERIALTGNTIVEAVQRLLPDAAGRSGVVTRILGADPRTRARFAVATFHRPENVDDPVTLECLLTGLAQVRLPVVWPVHPRTRARIEAFGLAHLLAGVTVTDPLGPVDFLALAAEAAVWISDSGGLQEEASILKRPVLVVRRSTERPEVLGTFSRLVTPGTDLGAAVAELATDDAVAALAGLPTPYGDGTASRQIVELVDRLAGHPRPADAGTVGP
ncbi:MAG: non-hydrolyzing UDP-N-acetylglucosamine 2-epimerase [Acidimicrobiia bacterium]